MVNTNLLNNYVFQLKGTLTTAGTSVAISHDLELDQVVSFTDGYIAMRNSNGTQVERMKATASAGTLTISIRGLPQNQSLTPDPTLYKPRTEGTIVYITVLAQNYATLQDDNIWTGLNTFNGNVVVGSQLSIATAGGSFKGPVYASLAAINLAFPSPANGLQSAYATLEGQVYDAIAGSRQPRASGTNPNASTTVAGRSQEGTISDNIAHTEIGTTGAPLFMSPKNTVTISVGSADEGKAILANSTGTIDPSFFSGSTLALQTSQALVDSTTYVLGVGCTVGQSLFTEAVTSFANATTIQPVSNIYGHQRVGIKTIGSGTSASTMKLSLRKYGTPTQSLTVRIETDDGSGNPSGTLVNVNATTTVAQAGLTTSLVDTTITFPGSFTITRGTVVHIVVCQGTYGSETIDITNYYGLGYSTNDTNTRTMQYYNGTVWVIFGASVTDSNGTLNATASGQTIKTGMVIFSKFNQYLTQVSAPAGTSFTKLYVYAGNDSTSLLLFTGDFVGDICYLSFLMSASTYYTILADHPSGTYTLNYATGASYPVNRTNINYITGNGGDSTDYKAFDSMTTTAISTLSFFPYIGGSLFESTLLALSDATYSYKIPTDLSRIATETKTIGQQCITTVFGINANLSGLSSTNGTPYYITNTPGAIGTTPGTNERYVGRNMSTTHLWVEEDLGMILTPITMANNTVYTASRDGIVNAYATADGGGTHSITLSGYSDLVNGSTTLVAVSNAFATTTGSTTISFVVRKGYMYKVLIGGGGTPTLNSAFFYPLRNN